MLYVKSTLIICLLFFCAMPAKADHITGGQLFYSFIGSSNGQYNYNITLKLLMVCNTIRQFNDPTFVSFFDKGTNARIKDVSVNLARTEQLSLTPGGPCITNPPTVCYRVGYYDFSISLPASKNGYVLSSQVIFRVDGMKNLVTGYDQVGALYTAEIPGNSVVANGPENNSARFTGSDLVVICANNSFSYSFAAKDDDGDQLSYSFCNAYRESSSGFGESGNPTGPPPYNSVPYGQGYSGSLPLGGNVSINSTTGMLSGIAPAEGTYVISVCVQETRNNTVIATQQKDIQVTITSCSIAAATLLPAYNVCGDSKTISLANLSTSQLIKTYDWEFINAAGAVVFKTTEKLATYTFPDTGIYLAKLMINKTDACSDSATTTIRVYPGFVPAFGFNGICIHKPTQFTDASISVYGTVDKWSWDFGDNAVAGDISDEQNPSYTYTASGSKNARLIVSDSKGCTDTIFHTIAIVDKPPLGLAFRDTLICQPDSISIAANGNGIYSWTPDIYMSGANTSSPIVAPPVTTTYYVNLDDNGCLNNDSVTINVVDHVSLEVMADTIICSGDPVTLNVVSNGLQYSWTPASQLNNAHVKNPVAVTPGTTVYEVLSAIGSCQAKGNITISAVNYPLALAGNDTLICFQTSANLHGTTDGSTFNWAPQASLQFSNSLDPIAHPSATTSYVLTAYDTKGCPKPGIDTITVTVLPLINAHAGKDTAVVIGQPLQLNASGGSGYEWSPGTGLSATDIANPVAVYTAPSEGIPYKVLVYNEAGCVDSAFLTVKVFKTVPEVFVPTAFTPNGDGRNDVLKPIAVGMQRIELFNIYNRWGQLVFSTSLNGKGWNGMINGIQQGPGTYVWMVKAIDYTGAPYMQKGTAVLIR